MQTLSKQPTNVLKSASPEEAARLTLRDRIQRGIYKRGTRIPSERIISEELNVGRSTVRNALLRLEEQGWITRKPGCRPVVSDMTAEEPLPGGRQLQGRANGIKKQNIATVMPIHQVYGAAQSILTGINNQLRQREAPYRMLLFDTNSPTGSGVNKLELEALDAIEHEELHGAILWFMGGDETRAVISRLTERNVPLVFVDRLPSGAYCDFVGTENRSAARLAVEHLIGLGHRRIAHVTDTDAATVIPDRGLGYREALMAHGIAPDPDLTFTWSLEDDMDPASAIDAFFKLQDAPTAVFAVNDMRAHDFILQAESRGLRVPADISVVGFDDLERYVPQPIALTTIHQTFHQIGERAAELLLRRLASTQPLPYQHVLLPAHLVIRGTTGRKLNI